MTDQKNELAGNKALLISACAGVICSSIVVPFYSIGALVVPITTEFGWTRAEFQLALLFSTPMLFAQIFDSTGTYDLGFLIATGCFAAGAVMVLLLGKYPRSGDQPIAEPASTNPANA